MTTGYNICKTCRCKINLTRRSKNPQSKIKDVCLKCYYNSLPKLRRNGGD